MRKKYLRLYVVYVRILSYTIYIKLVAFIQLDIGYVL